MKTVRPLVRRASRLLILNDARQILLFRYEDERGSWWATPGGGLETDETFEDAAAREAREELGLSNVALTFQWERTSEFQSRGQFIRQTERYFLTHPVKGRAAMTADVSHAHRLEGILATRWWSGNDLRNSTEPVFPEDLADRLDSVFSSSAAATAP